MFIMNPAQKVSKKKFHGGHFSIMMSSHSQITVTFLLKKNIGMTKLSKIGNNTIMIERLKKHKSHEKPFKCGEACRKHGCHRYTKSY